MSVLREEIPTVRILPMSDKVRGFSGLSIEEVQRKWFLGRLPAGGGRFHYRSAGLNAARGTVVLFQFQARIIASGVFWRDEKFARPAGGYGGILHFDAETIRTFEPVDIEGMRAVWPGIRGFGHVKQFLNPALYGKFKKRLKRVAAPL
ncbi:MAG TPA: hypothetical protein VGN88_12755 [Phycisphaerae bacterium]